MTDSAGIMYQFGIDRSGDSGKMLYVAFRPLHYSITPSIGLIHQHRLSLPDEATGDSITLDIALKT